MISDPLLDIGHLIPGMLPYISDEMVSEIMVNPDGKAFVERRGRLEHLDFEVRQNIVELVAQRIAASLDTWISYRAPLLEARLSDGSRVAAACPPVSLPGWSLSIRKFPTRRYSARDLVEFGAMTEAQLQFLAGAVSGRKNILLSGGTGTGKTTMLNALTEFIPDEQRILLIEDVAEIVLPLSKWNNARLQMRKEEGEGKDKIKAVTIRDCLKHVLRMRPDRVILGEVRDAEAYDLLQVLNSGHSGTLSTAHADSGLQALERLTSLAMIADVLPFQSVRGLIGSSINVVVQIERRPDGGRGVKEILLVEGYDYGSNRFVTRPWEEGHAQTSNTRRRVGDHQNWKRVPFQSPRTRDAIARRGYRTRASRRYQFYAGDQAGRSRVLAAAGES